MKRNIEIKARVHNLERLLDIGRTMANEEPVIMFQQDVYFVCDVGRLKLRIFTASFGEIIYYIRDDCSESRVSSYSIKATDCPIVVLEDYANKYGIRNIVRKRRHLFIIGRTRIHLDEVERLGEFVELEVVLNIGDTLKEGHHEAQQISNMFGIKDKDRIAKSYIDLMEGVPNNGVNTDPKKLRSYVTLPFGAGYACR